MTQKDRVLELVRKHPGMPDGDIAKLLNLSHVRVNQLARELEREKKIRRTEPHVILNFPNPWPS